MPGEGVTAATGAGAARDDVALVGALACGDRAALAALYDRHAALLLGLGVRILGERATAEDVLHDVFLEAWHHAAEFDPARGTVRAWLVTRMRSRALDRRGKQARAAQAAEDTRAAAPPPAADRAAGFDRERVRSGVAALGPELAAVIELAYFEGLSASEVAARLGVPAGTVKSRLARAVATLRERIAPDAAPRAGGVG